MPVVLLVLEGGPNTVRTMCELIKKKIPAVVVDGSGRAADVVAYAYSHTIKKWWAFLVLSFRLNGFAVAYIHHFTNETGTGAEIRPAIVSGIVIDFLRVLRFTFPVRVRWFPLSRLLCHRKHKKFPARTLRLKKNFLSSTCGQVQDRHWGRARQLLIDFIFRSSNIFLGFCCCCVFVYLHLSLAWCQPIPYFLHQSPHKVHLCLLRSRYSGRHAALFPTGEERCVTILITAAKETKEPLFSSTFSFVTLVLFTPCLSSPNFEHQWFIRDLFSHIGRSLYFLRWLLAFFFLRLSACLFPMSPFPYFVLVACYWTVCISLHGQQDFPRSWKCLFGWLVGWVFWRSILFGLHTLATWIVSNNWPDV